MHLASVAADFSVLAGLHRWFMTYSSGFHRRGLVGTVFQFLVGDLPRAAQIEVASQVSAIGTYLWLIAALGVFLVVAARVKNNAFRWAALAFAAFAFINPMWTTRAFDNGFLDWLVGLAVVGALTAFACRRPLLSGALVAVSIVAYWGTIFVWLPLGFLIFARSAKESRSLVRMFATGRRRELFALLLPLASALFSALLHDDDAAIAELTRIGGQENIIRETFSGEWTGLLRQIETLLTRWRTYLAIAAVFVLPPMLCAGLWTCFMRRCGYSLFQRAWLDIGVAVVATMAPLSFLLVAFDLSRLMAWTYFAFYVVAVFWLVEARPNVERAPTAILPWTVAPLVLAAFFWTSPTIYSWVDVGRLIPCERFCFKEHTPQGRALDLYRRRAISSPIWEYAAPGGLLPGAVGRVVRADRDEAGWVMDINYLLNDTDPGVTVRGPEQTQRAVIGHGPYRLSISYRSEGTDTGNAETRFYLYNSTWTGTQEVFRAFLPASQTEFVATITPPPHLAGNVFRWKILYYGIGAFDLHEASITKVGQER